MLGLTVLKGDQHVDNHTVLDHAKPRCESRELYKGIYADRSSGVFNGTIIVRPDAQKTNAFQSNRALLLSTEASIDSQPQLKIWADDVKCTHGATVGQLDEDSLFYLRSRGIPYETARGMLIHAFAGEVVSEIGIKELKAYVEDRLEKALF
jgi:Fe-S cluster assembly protein SufD